MPEHALIVSFLYPSRDLCALFELEDQLIAAIDAAEVGEFDRNDVAEGGTAVSIYMYGPNGNRLFEAGAGNRMNDLVRHFSPPSLPELAKSGACRVGGGKAPMP